MKRAAAVLLVLVAAVVLTATASSRTASTRQTADQPDDLQGAQIHFVYALPSDGTDRSLDTNGTLAASIANIQSWLRSQTGGHGLRVDTFGGAPDITFFRSSQTEAQLKAFNRNLRDELEKEIKAAGLVQPDKLYGIYYDGQSNGACGGGAYPPTLPGIAGAIYLPSTYWNTSGYPCYEPEKSLNGMNLMDYAIFHELMHTMGFVPSCAPHQVLAGHVSDSPTDLMYAGSEDWHPSVLDYGRDDYAGAHIAGCLDLLDVKWLEGNGPWKLTVSVSGPGHAVSTAASISCTATCSAWADPDASVTLTAVPDSGAQFSGWSGACTGTSTTCVIKPGSEVSVAATFAASTPKAKSVPRCRKGQRSTKKHPCRKR